MALFTFITAIAYCFKKSCHRADMSKSVPDLDPRREDQRVVTSERVESLYFGLNKINKESVLF